MTLLATPVGFSRMITHSESLFGKLSVGQAEVKSEMVHPALTTALPVPADKKRKRKSLASMVTAGN